MNTKTLQEMFSKASGATAKVSVRMFCMTIIFCILPIFTSCKHDEDLRNQERVTLCESGLPKSGHYGKSLAFTIPSPQGDDGAIIACDMTGALPTANSKCKSGCTVNLKKTTVMRCAQFKDGTRQSDPIMRTYIIGRLPDLPIVSIAVDPHDMFDKKHGLYSKGPNAEKERPYYGANYWKKTELPVQIEFFEKGMDSAWTHQAGLRIFGGFSRTLAKKSVVITFRKKYGANRLNYRLLPDNPELTSFKHFLLRNNGNNFNLDYIRDMLMTSLTEGLGIDYQRGRATVVYYNGEYFGIHNIRERANGDYFETKYNIKEKHVDLIKVKDDEVSSGSDDDYQDIIKWLESLNGLSDDELRLLEQRIDVDNFTYNWMCRIYYKDTDWPQNNMKRWRVNNQPSRWKWLMYDTDYGWECPIAGWPTRNMMSYVAEPDGRYAPPKPQYTLLFRKLLENDDYKNSFINRFSLLMTTYFASDRVNARIDALMAPIQDEIPHDYKKWKRVWWKRLILRLKYGSTYTLDAQMDVIRNFNDVRQIMMKNEIESYFGLNGGVDFTVSVNGNGKILVHNMEVLNDSATFIAYSAAPVVLKAVAVDGAEFESWSDGVTDAERVVAVTEGHPIILQAIFK